MRTRVIELEDGRISSTYALHTAQGEPSAPERLIPFKVPARKEDRIMLFDPAELLFATSRDGKTFLRTAKNIISLLAGTTRKCSWSR